jgi:hypothetical protein
MLERKASVIGVDDAVWTPTIGRWGVVFPIDSSMSCSRGKVARM